MCSLTLLEINLSALSFATQILGNSSTTQIPSGHRSGLGDPGRHGAHGTHLPSREAAARSTGEWYHPDTAPGFSKIAHNKVLQAEWLIIN